MTIADKLQESDFIDPQSIDDLFGFLVNHGSEALNAVNNEISENSFSSISYSILFRSIKSYLSYKEKSRIDLDDFAEYLKYKYKSNEDLSQVIDYLGRCKNRTITRLSNLDLAKDRAIGINRGSAKYKLYKKTLELLNTLSHDPADVTNGYVEQVKDLVSDLNQISDLQQAKADFDLAEVVLTQKYQNFDREDFEDERIKIPTGFTPLDQALDGGIRKASYTVIGARPSVGKTALAVNIMAGIMFNEHKNNDPKPILFFSLEMSSNDIIERLCAGFTGISPDHLFTKDDPQNIRKPFIFYDVAHAYKEVISDSKEHTYLAICDKAGLTIDEIKGVVQQALNRFGGLSAVVIDYIQMIPTNPQQNRTNAIADISRYFAGLSKTLKIPVIALAQLNRDMEKGLKGEIRAPRMSDIKECGQIEQDVDLGLLLHRNKNDNEHIQIIIGKNRKGRLGTVNCEFVGETYLFVPEHSDNDKFDFLIEKDWQYSYQQALKPEFRN